MENIETVLSRLEKVRREHLVLQRGSWREKAVTIERRASWYHEDTLV